MIKTIPATLAVALTALLGVSACGGSADPEAGAIDPDDTVAPLDEPAVDTIATGGGESPTSAPAITEPSSESTSPPEPTSPPHNDGDLSPSTVASQLTSAGLGCEDYTERSRTRPTKQ